jgi:hypothetical protein
MISVFTSLCSNRQTLQIKIVKYICCLKEHSRAGGVAQVVQHLLSKALSSNPSTAKKKKTAPYQRAFKRKRGRKGKHIATFHLKGHRLSKK